MLCDVVQTSLPLNNPQITYNVHNMSNIFITLLLYEPRSVSHFRVTQNPWIHPSISPISHPQENEGFLSHVATPGSGYHFFMGFSMKKKQQKRAWGIPFMENPHISC